MAGLQGLFDEQARERGLHLIWVEHDLMDPRTVSRRDMRAKVTNYMRAIIQAEPTDESFDRVRRRHHLVKSATVPAMLREARSLIARRQFGTQTNPFNNKTDWRIK